ncbi:RNA polymerase sigma factor [Luteimonas sp. M1R5S18]|jgi:RNA polymerase sigma factor (sigma-70 family)|uniref:RNA polymerase sigma factor n=1 Tax=Luteimonas rhizosphaericola TaxID=3042024 RepID=A0ABT6JES6_9GAMM|nr:RNA polymerase sigma factor [Luteimonas rhizosphaericola]MDH5828960.1 RNA polymerase sigma factor [Luteimonas rhizosphaericola]
MAQSDLQRRIDAVWREESPKVVAALMRMVRDLDLAEELAQDALVTALERWPDAGLPDNPGAWLMATAKHRAIDHLRRHQLRLRKHAQIAQELDGLHDELHAAREESLDDDIGDDLLRLIFVACHPILSVEARTALTLRLLCGLTTDEIARAFLVPEATVAQRIVRAKRTLGEADVPFEVPRRDELPERLSAVLGVVYLVFNEGYAATAGDDWMRPALCAEALRLGRLLVGLAPGEPETFGLLALMELQASRAAARTGPDGEPVLLQDQDRSRWDHEAIERGLRALAQAERAAGGPGPYTLQAAIAACHARAASVDTTDWARIVALYDALAELAPTPVVALNRAVAVSMHTGPADGLALVDALVDAPALRSYHLLPAVRGDLLHKLGRGEEARAEFLRAAEMTRNARERGLLLARADAALA